MGKALSALLVFLGTGILAVCLVPLSRSLAGRFGIVDQPGPRKIHSTPTPRLGGLAIFVAFQGMVWSGYFLLPVLVRLDWAQQWFGPALDLLHEAHRVETRLMGFLGGSALAFVVGLVDDVRGSAFPVWVKALGQVLAAVVVMASGVATSFAPYDWMNTVITILWLVGITNAFNLLDNMDGLSAGVAFVASGVLLMNAWSLGEFFICLLLVAFMGSLLGFLFFNFNPASVFLGDCGSLFIGYVIGSLTLLERYLSHASSTLFPVLMPLMVCAVPLTDTATVMFVRLRERRPVYVGDARHLSHRLVSAGFSQRSAVLLLYLMTFSLGLGAASLTDATVGQSLLVVLQLFGFVTLVLILIFVDRRRHPREKTSA